MAFTFLLQNFLYCCTSRIRQPRDGLIRAFARKKTSAETQETGTRESAGLTRPGRALSRSVQLGTSAIVEGAENGPSNSTTSRGLLADPEQIRRAEYGPLLYES